MSDPGIIEVWDKNKDFLYFFWKILLVAHWIDLTSITNMVGTKVKETTIPTNRDHELRLDVAPGIYFIHATIAGSRYVQRVVVSR